MRSIVGLTLTLLGFVGALSGCASQNGTSTGKSWQQKLLPFAKPQEKPELDSPTWMWRPALPKAETRADLVTLDFPSTTLAHLLPELEMDAVRFVSTANQHLSLTHINSRPVTTLADALQRTEDVPPSALHQVDFATAGGADTLASRVDTVGLEELLHQVCSRYGCVKLEESGATWAVSSHGVIRCRISPRVDRERGLVHLVVGIKNCGAAPVTVPQEIRAFVDQDQPMRCLSTAQTLAKLYPVQDGKPSMKAPTIESASTSFSEASEDAEYLMATNYDSLSTAYADRQLVPALLSGSDEPYPGGAVLADARALGAFLLQKKILPADAPEHIGWILLEGPIRTAESLQIVLDFGQGQQVVEFELPAS